MWLLRAQTRVCMQPPALHAALGPTSESSQRQRRHQLGQASASERGCTYTTPSQTLSRTCFMLHRHAEAVRFVSLQKFSWPPHLQVMQRVRLEHAEERLLPLLEAELRVLRERAVDVAADDLPPRAPLSMPSSDAT